MCAVAKKPVRCLRGHGDPVRIKRLANRPIKVLSATLLDKRGYGNLSGSIGVCHPERSDSSGCHPERAKRVEGSRAAAGARCASEPMAASDVAFLAPELVSEAEGPVPVPAPAEGRLGYRFVKRVFDIAFSACAIAVLLVPSIVLCIAIRLESPGCPIYSQKRVGRIGRSGEVRTFDMYKFRSMHKDADERLAELQELNEADGPLFKIKDDPRVTRIGKFIRKHSIDELPQFLNCLAGQLSCVGPRPPLPSEVAQYDARAMRRLSVKPGLTGYWQVRGRSDTGFEEMVDLDLKYIEERSFLVDLKVIAKTVAAMFDGKGAC